MTEKKLSTLGYLMDRLGLSTAGLARRLHVDASLVSKWRSGNRRKTDWGWMTSCNPSAQRTRLSSTAASGSVPR